MKNNIKSLVLIFVAASALTFNACGSDETPKEPEQTQPPVPTETKTVDQPPQTPSAPIVMSAKDSLRQVQEQKAKDSTKSVQDSLQVIEQKKQDSVKTVQDSLLVIEQKEKKAKDFKDSIAVTKQKAVQDSIVAVEKEQADERYLVAKTVAERFSYELETATKGDSTGSAKPVDYLSLTGKLSKDFSKAYAKGTYTVTVSLEQGTDVQVITVTDSKDKNKKTVLINGEFSK